jgi:hypothetical protein
MQNRTSISDAWYIGGLQASSKNATLGPEGPKFCPGTFCLDTCFITVLDNRDTLQNVGNLAFTEKLQK